LTDVLQQLCLLIEQRFGELPPTANAEVRRSLDRQLAAAERLRTWHLTNADEPASWDGRGMGRPS